MNGVWGLRFPSNVDNKLKMIYQNRLENQETTLLRVKGQTPTFSLDGVSFISSPPIRSQRESLFELDLKKKGYPNNMG